MTSDEQSDRIVLERHRPLHLVQNTPKGRGVFAAQPIPAGTTIDISPVLILDPTENKNHIEHTVLYNYTYNWPNPNPDPTTTQAVVFGLGSMFNHSRSAQNVGWRRDLEREVIVYRALRDIREGEELCISYGDHLTFEDVDAKDEDGEEEVGEEVLGRIDLDEG